MPKVTSGALLVAKLAGSLSIGLCVANIIHNNGVSEKLAAFCGVKNAAALTYWDGAAHLAHATMLTRTWEGQDPTWFLFAWKVAVGSMVSSDADHGANEAAQNFGLDGDLELIGGPVQDSMSGAVTFNTGDTVSHQGRSFLVTRAADGGDVDWFTSLDGSPVVVTYGQLVTVVAQTPSRSIDGQYYNGTAYLGRTVDGMILNPGNRAYSGVVPYDVDSNFYSDVQGCDSLADPVYESALNRDSYTITQGTVVQATSDLTPPSSMRPGQETFSIVHVIEEAPESVDVFRSGQSSAAPSVVGSKSIVDAYVAALPTRPAPPSWSFDIQSAINHWRIPEQVQHIFGNKGRELYPSNRTQTGDGYGRDYGRFVGQSLRALYTTTYSLEFRQALAVAMVQVGIDLHDRTFNEGGEFPGNGALNNGRWPLVAFAATVLDDAEMKANVAGSGSVRRVPNIARWHEIGQIFDIDNIHLDDHMPWRVYAAVGVADGGTGYQVGDELTIVGGVARDNMPPRFVVTQVNSTTGQIERFNSAPIAGHYWVTPGQDLALDERYKTTGGSGVGATFRGRPSQIVHPAMIGELGWSTNPNERHFPDPVQTARNQLYYHINISATLALIPALRHLPGVMETLEAPKFFAMADRMFFEDVYPGEEYDAWALEDWATYREFDQTGHPTIQSAQTSIDGEALWLKFDRELRHGRAHRPSASDFLITVNGSVVTRPVDGHLIYGKAVLFSVNVSIARGDKVRVTYAPATGSARLQDHTGNMAMVFTNLMVINSVQ